MRGKSLLSLLVGLCAYVISTSAIAEGPNSLDQLESGTVQRDSLALSNLLGQSFDQELLKTIADRCEKGNCAIVSISRRNKGVSLHLGCGEGSATSGGAGGNNYYIGGAATDGKADQTNCYAGIVVKNEKCTARFDIPQPQFVNFIRHQFAARVEGSSSEMNKLNPEIIHYDRLQYSFATVLQNACANK